LLFLPKHGSLIALPTACTRNPGFSPFIEFMAVDIVFFEKVRLIHVSWHLGVAME
jgi:hypothetical protein